ncbi:hypothetical protein SEA_YAKULT_63 [Gordonia phage Yakult]|nr:hypothetical protein SEA_YAKULT_63 [Gordonia phage Yakult]
MRQRMSPPRSVWPPLAVWREDERRWVTKVSGREVASQDLGAINSIIANSRIAGKRVERPEL